VVDVRWDRYPLVSTMPLAKTWLQIQADLGLAGNTVEAYGRALQDYLAFSADAAVRPETDNRAHVAAYVRDLTSRSSRRGAAFRIPDTGAGLANATLQQRLTAVRLFHDYLIEEGVRTDNPVGRGRYTPGKGFGGARERGIVPRYRKLPWIPSEEQWQAVLQAARIEPVRNRMMLALAYDAALRREELCSLTVADVDPAVRMVRIRAETTKGRSRDRVVPYSAATGELFAEYLRERRALSRERGPLFISASRRNRGEPVSVWTWSKVIENISERAGVRRFTTHTLRHLCLTDLARAGWDLHEIALFAGHRSVQTTMLYIHLSGRELAKKLERGMAEIHAWRASQLAGVSG